jgi:hypothetical protein
LVIHEVPSHLAGPIRKAVWVLVVRGREENHSRINCSRADTEEVRGIGNGFTERGRRRVIRARGPTPDPGTEGDRPRLVAVFGCGGSTGRDQ